MSEDSTAIRVAVGVRALPRRRSLILSMLVFLLLVDLLLITAHLTRGLLGEPTSRLFDLTTEIGYGEFFQAVKSGWCVLVLIWLTRWRRSWLYLAWAAVCAFLLADDVLSLHEAAGAWIGNTFGDGTQRAAHLGEVLFLGAVAVPIIPLVWISWRHPREWDRTSLRRLSLLIAVLAVFGVGVDALHSLVLAEEYSLLLLLNAIEDGGELITMSLILAVLVSSLVLGHRREAETAAAQGQPPPP